MPAATELNTRNSWRRTPEPFLPGWISPRKKTAVVIDPPRKGCSAEFLAQLFAFGPGKVVYVSCNPATQIRDLAEFDKAGYFVTAVQPFDLFPQTKHLECVVTLKKNT
ncbi:hypothetical protein O4G20_04460 [Akkermansia muciniphila]|uniref:hypothetical protein n=1 Tax=Akkermansia muciniphila TaxID=239935 RepID=UPI0027D31140|nr:hypothetical protein [Akkermansia muciniphila]WMB22971.1 hypothetical protein O4G20_04460 [Akkermansia muciniphila]